MLEFIGFHWLRIFLIPCIFKYVRFRFACVTQDMSRAALNPKYIVLVQRGIYACRALGIAGLLFYFRASHLLSHRARDVGAYLRSLQG